MKKWLGVVIVLSLLGLLVNYLVKHVEIVREDTADTETLVQGISGTLWACGLNYRGELGLGDTTDRSSFTQVPDLTNVVAAAAGGGHSLALRGDGTVWACGYSESGHLGLGDRTSRSSFTQVPGLTNVVALAAGSHSLVLTGP